MKLSWALLHPKLPHRAAVDLASRVGVDGYDLVLIGHQQSIDLDDLLSDPVQWAGRLEERVCSRGLSFADVFFIPEGFPASMAPNHPDRAEVEAGRDMFRKMVDFAVRVGSPGITMLPGIEWSHENLDDSIARAALELRTRVSEAHERGIRLSIEPHNGSICSHPSNALRLCEQVPGLELTVDYSHYVSQGFPEVDIEPLLGYARHVHARGSADGRVQTPLSESTIDWGRVVDTLRARDYDGYIAVEYVWSAVEEGMNEVDVIAESVMLLDELRGACGRAST